MPEDPGSPTDLSRQDWAWPAFFLISADPRCTSSRLRDASRSLPAATALLDGKKAVPALLAGLLGACCYMQVNQDQKAQDQLEWLRNRRTTTLQLVRDDPLWPLVEQCYVYLSMQKGLARTVRSPNTRPAIVIAAFEVRDCPDLDDLDAASAAITWMVLESMERVIRDYPLAGGKRCLSVDEDLALRFSDKRVCGVNSVYDTPIPSGDLNFGYPAYMHQIFDSGKTFIGGYLRSDNTKTFLHYADLDTAAVANQGTVERIVRSTGKTVNNVERVRRYDDMGGLALDVALDILSHFPVSAGTSPIPAPGSGKAERRTLPKGNEQFLEFVEAVGYESRGNYCVARECYDAMLPSGTPGPEWSFVVERRDHCSSLLKFDKPERFLRRNLPHLRERVLELF